MCLGTWSTILSMALPVSLAAFAETLPQPPMASLVVTGRGLMNVASASDPAPAGAIRRAKAAIQLGLVEDVFELPSPKFRPPQLVVYEPRESIETVAVPAALAGALARLTVAPVIPQASLRERVATVGTGLAREEQRDPTKRRAARGSAEAMQAQFDQHCARIATAAEWMFDAA